MQTYHIHIKGLVQGVGFRPFVCQAATLMELNGCVSNTSDGVHIAINALPEEAKEFYEYLVRHQPVNSMITDHTITEIAHKEYTDFSIIHSIPYAEPDLLLTPDIAICESCRAEIHDSANRRYGYAFTTCLNCGPRYSIQKALPYDRVNTTMAEMEMCVECSIEYHDFYDRRHYSQTNSCPDCPIQMQYFAKRGERIEELLGDEQEIISLLCDHLATGKIIATKGTGGYLLLCDAANKESIELLRTRKNRPAKPLAVLYPSLDRAAADFDLRAVDTDALVSRVAPILLCRPKAGLKICRESIAPGLDKIGVMLPSTPMLELIATTLNRPIVATSGNISGSPIIYKDEDALEQLFEVADYILTYDREIVAPQDDSVMMYTDHGHKIMMRRSRGLAPNYFPAPYESQGESILAMGSELKSAFAIQQKNNVFISQYLGDQGSLESQQSFMNTLEHLQGMLRFRPDTILVDKHPAYFVSEMGRKLASELHQEAIGIQHHHAHFGAVLAEHNLIDNTEPILGIIWDGTGYGDDGQIWGGEVFCKEGHQMARLLHLKYIPQLLGDKMSREPRLSALSLLHKYPQYHYLLRDHFSDTSWNYYQKFLDQEQAMTTSSMGRLLDGLACLLGLGAYNSFEGELAMKLEALAARCRAHQHDHLYSIPIADGIIDTSALVEELVEDIILGDDPSWLALKIFHSLAKLIEDISEHTGIDRIAFSGGFFQNGLLHDLITQHLGLKKTLYFHKQLSPNDECIGFGQLAIHHMNLEHFSNHLNHQHVSSHSGQVS